MKVPYKLRPEFLELKRDWDTLRPYLYLLRKGELAQHLAAKGGEND